MVEVYAGVLDLSLADWFHKSGNMFEKELTEQQNKIINVVTNKLRIKHGHIHALNFVLRFFRNENNEPDITKVPRLYLIDFDEAISL